MAEIGVTEGGKADLRGTDTLHLLAITEDLHLGLVLEIHQVQLLVRTCSRAIPTFGTRHTVHKPECFQCLHLVTNGSWIALQHARNLLTFYRMRHLMVQGYQGYQDILLNRGEIHSHQLYHIVSNNPHSSSGETYQLPHGVHSHQGTVV